jgi:hypothetical protein
MQLRFIVILGLLGILTQGIGAETDGRAVGFDWYKTQFGSGGTGNCGPACAAMAVHWATGKTISVWEVRNQIGEPNGSRATSLEHQKWVITKNAVKCRFAAVKSVADLVAIVKRGHIAIIWIHTGKISMPKGNVALTKLGRYYPDECGHYIVVHGLSADGRFFVVHDPAPGDWATNTVRYPDGGMLGRNRYFAVSEVWASLMQKRVIEVLRR